VTKVDLIVLGFVALTAFIGWKKGLIASALSLAGVVLGVWLGSRLAPQLLQHGTHSPYTPLAALAGAAVGAILLETIGSNSSVRTSDPWFAKYIWNSPSSMFPSIRQIGEARLSRP